jgi:hypothetical protein
MAPHPHHLFRNNILAPSFPFHPPIIFLLPESNFLEEYFLEFLTILYLTYIKISIKKTLFKPKLNSHHFFNNSSQGLQMVKTSLNKKSSAIIPKRITTPILKCAKFKYLPKTKAINIPLKVSQ